METEQIRQEMGRFELGQLVHLELISGNGEVNLDKREEDSCESEVAEGGDGNRPKGQLAPRHRLSGHAVARMLRPTGTGAWQLKHRGTPFRI